MSAPHAPERYTPVCDAAANVRCLKDVFARFSRRVANAVGSPLAFLIAAGAIVIWAVLGPAFDYSEGWQLVVNTGTTIVTFLVVFMIQSTQNKDSKALHLKLDELIYVMSKARNQLIDCEDLPDEELAKLDAEFQAIRNSDPDPPTPAPPVGTRMQARPRRS
ncbi:MAG TPA: low affinity iron permease family protein [Kofleriaceae bacterium]|nr:low affinity iron permease family protein [Kofleriaceae bacterium]